MDNLQGINPDEYSIRFARMFENSSTCVIIEVSAEAVKQVLGKLDYGKDGICAFITTEGKEFVYVGGKSDSTGVSLEITSPLKYLRRNV